MTFKTKVKILLAVLFLVSAALGLAQVIYAPHTLVAESSPDMPAWFSYADWGLATLVSGAYILVDWWKEH